MAKLHKKYLKQQPSKERIISKFKFSWHLNPPPPSNICQALTL